MATAIQIKRYNGTSWDDLTFKVDWEQISNKPTNFPPTAHTHDDRYYTETEIDGKITTLNTNIKKYVPLAGGTMTGTLTVPNINSIDDSTARTIATGKNASSYFQSRKFRGEGTSDSYIHSVDFGYSGHDRVDFYEYGKVWNFWIGKTWRNTPWDEVDEPSYLCLKIGETYVKNKANTFTWPSTSGTLALKKDLDSYLPLSGGKLTGNLESQYLTGTWLRTTADVHLSSKASNFAVIQDGWIYSRTASEIVSDLGISSGLTQTTLWTGMQGCEMGMPWTSVTLSQAIENYSLIAFQFEINGGIRTFILPRTDIGDTAGTQSNGSNIIAGPDEEYKFDCYINGSTDLKIKSLAGDFALYHIIGFK